MSYIPGVLCFAKVEKCAILQVFVYFFLLNMWFNQLFSKALMLEVVNFL